MSSPTIRLSGGGAGAGENNGGGGCGNNNSTQRTANAAAAAASGQGTMPSNPPAFREAEDELTETLFNGFDNYADSLLMDDVVALMSGWQQTAGAGGNAAGGKGGGAFGQIPGGAGAKDVMHLTTVLDDDVPLPAALQNMMSQSGTSEDGPAGGEKSGGSHGSFLEYSDEASSSMADEFDEEEMTEDGGGGAGAGSQAGAPLGKPPKKTRVRKGSSAGAGSGGGVKVVVDQQKQKLRNREHARNTRLRKKAYLETLRTQLQSLSDAKDKSDKTQQVSQALHVENRAMKKQVLQTFLLYRARGELDRHKWAALLSDDFVMKLPVTPYRYFPASDVENQTRYVRGIDATIRDTASFVVLIDSLSRTYRERVRVQFYAEAQYIIMAAGPGLMCRWSMKSENAVACGCQIELALCGMLQAEFSPIDAKLTKLSIVYDVMGFMQQLRRVCGGQLFQTAPSTLQMAEDPTEEPRIVFALQAPFRIRSINEAWMMHYGVTVEECQNKCMVLERNPLCPLPNNSGQGEGKGMDPALQYIQFAYECLAKQLCHSLVVLYHTKTQGPIGARLRLFPVFHGGHVTHFMGGLTSLRDSSFPTDYPTVLTFR